jgi:hypothetical protein
MPIVLTRTHRWGFETQGTFPFGIGTGHPYELFLILDAQFQGIELILPEGGRVRYSRISPGTGLEGAVFEHTSTPSMFFKSRIQKLKKWELFLKDGSTYTFTDSVHPLLLSIKDRYGNKISIARGPTETGRATRVVSPNGRWLEFVLDVHDNIPLTSKVLQVRDNIGRVVTYG